MLGGSEQIRIQIGHFGSLSAALSQEWVGGGTEQLTRSGCHCLSGKALTTPSPGPAMT